jgi:hypothetical protein
MGNFIQGVPVAGGDLQGQGMHRGIGFIGFRFNNGAGVQYGWARIKISGVPHYDFVLLDYAYADPGERLTAGQTLENTSSEEQAPDQGSLGGLALGAVGLLAWRKSRKSLTARLEDAQDDVVVRIGRGAPNDRVFRRTVLMLFASDISHS